jgi:hypothetical protein
MAAMISSTRLPLFTPGPASSIRPPDDSNLKIDYLARRRETRRGEPPGKITGATTNAIVVLAAMMSKLRKEMSLLPGPRQSFTPRPAFPFKIYFLLAILIVHNGISANVQLLSKM